MALAAASDIAAAEAAARAGAELRPFPTEQRGGRAGVVPFLLELYRTSRLAPEAFRAEYGASVARATALIADASRAELEAPCGEDAETALHYAAACGSIELCRLLLSRAPRLNHDEDASGATALLWAVEHGMLRVAELLLAEGANPAQTDFATGSSALHRAAALGYPQLCALLLDFASSDARRDELLEQRDARGWTPLHVAADAGSLAACRALVEGGADPYVESSFRVGAERGLRCTPLSLAAAAGHGAVAAYFERQCPEETPEWLEDHRWRVKRWSHRLGDVAADQQLPAASLCAGSAAARQAPLPQLSPPTLERAARDVLYLVSNISDVEYRVNEYILELARCIREGDSAASAKDVARSAAPARVYYARAGEQRKVDVVSFPVPRTRHNGIEIWRHGATYRFRLIGRCERSPASPDAPWQVISDWSLPARIPDRHVRRGG